MKSFAFKRRSREPKCRVDTARSNMVALDLKKASEWRSEWNIFIIKTIFSFNCCSTTAFKLTFHERVKCLPVTLGQFANYPTMKQKFARLSKHFTVFPTFGSCLKVASMTEAYHFADCYTLWLAILHYPVIFAGLSHFSLTKIKTALDRFWNGRQAIDIRGQTI